MLSIPVRSEIGSPFSGMKTEVSYFPVLHGEKRSAITIKPNVPELSPRSVNTI